MQGSLDEAHRLAEQVADGQPIDWGSLTLDDERFLSNLRAVERLADFHRRTWEELLAEDSDGELLEWGQLKVVEKVGQGGFGEVYLAVDPALEREVALKLLHPDKGEDAAQKASALKEGRLLAKIRHPNVATVYGVAEHEGRLGLWMEFVRGQTLEQLLESQGPMSAREAAGIGIEVCKALAAVHGQGLVHRDVKAQNVMRRQGGRILLMDFGLGEPRGSGEPGKKQGGTPLYMPLEVLRGQPATPQSDIYSLGVLLFYLATGDFPVLADDFERLKEQHQHGKLKLLSDVRPNLPNWFVDAVHRTLSTNPSQRFETVGQMERALSSGLSHSGTVPPVVQREAPSKIPFRLLLAALIVLLVVIVGLQFTNFYSPQPPQGLKPLGVVFADLNNSTQDAEFDLHVVDRLRRQLETRQLASIEFADRQDMQPALLELRLSEGDPIDSDRAAQIAMQLYRVPAVVEISISPIGGIYELLVEVKRLPVGPFQATLKSSWEEAFQLDRIEGINAALTDVANWLVQEPFEELSLQSLFYGALDLKNDQRHQQAIERLKQLLDKEPGFTLAHVILTSIHLELQNFRAGYLEASTVIKRLEGRRLHSIQDEFARMLLLHDIEDYLGGESHVRAMIARDGENYDRLFYLGYSLAAQGRFPEAAVAFEKAGRQDKRQIHAQVQLGKVQLIREDWEGLQRTIARLADMGDTEHFRFLLEGAAAWLQDRFQDADSAFQKLHTTTYPIDRSDAYSAQVYMLAERGKIIRAKAVLEEGILHDQSDKEMLGGSLKEKHLTRAYLEFRHGTSDRSQLLKDCDEATSDGSPHRLLRAGTILARADEIEAAQRYLDRLEKEKVDIPIYRRAIQKLRGEILIASKKDKQGLQEMRKAAVDDPAFYFREHLARALLEAGEIKDAGEIKESADEYARIIRQPGILWFLSVYEQYPGIYADTLLEAGRLLATQQGFEEEAKWALQRYLKLREEADEALQGDVTTALNLLAEIRD